MSIIKRSSGWYLAVYNNVLKGFKCVNAKYESQLDRCSAIMNYNFIDMYTVICEMWNASSPRNAFCYKVL